ncbi:kinase-like domain-containing protein [Phlebopus sp. FC_14]|nr:kinase-like domain-containing protein [Phlebopus sp. FC_14]
MRLPTPATTRRAPGSPGCTRHPSRAPKGNPSLKGALALKKSIRQSHQPARKESIKFHGFHGYYKGQVVQAPEEVRPAALCLEDLECIRTLGKGSYGSVVVVRVRPSTNPTAIDQPGSLFAMKVLQKTEMQEFDQRFPGDTDDERSTLAKLPWSPFINGVVSAFHDSLNLYLMLECIPSGVLHDVIYKRGPLDAATARFYYANIVSGLTFLHLHGVVHRDLKPTNILLRPDGYLTLADFGLAKPEEDAKKSSWNLVGTPVYMAPELFNDSQSGMGRGVDWWASGVVLYEMIVKRVPFYGKEDEEVFLRVERGRCRWPKNIRVGKSLKSLVAGLLTPNAASRLGVIEPVTDHPWLKDIDWLKLNGGRYIAPWVPGTPPLTQTWLEQRLPEQLQVPALRVAIPPEHKRNDHRLAVEKPSDV